MTWSFTMPVACIWAYMIVDPTKLNPRLTRSLLSGVRQRRLGWNLAQVGPGVLDRRAVHEAPDVGVEAAELPLNVEEARALLMALRIFARFRMMPVSSRSAATLSSP